MLTLTRSSRIGHIGRRTSLSTKRSSRKPLTTRSGTSSSRSKSRQPIPTLHQRANSPRHDSMSESLCVIPPTARHVYHQIEIGRPTLWTFVSPVGDCPGVPLHVSRPANVLLFVAVLIAGIVGKPIAPSAGRERD